MGAWLVLYGVGAACYALGVITAALFGANRDS